ncbi:MAG: DUF362 domain-containing protein [Candidatus Cloacimonetes bacterium]|nr:DUF362 domain-containing protein [Candidatus Cloacimonadota bacterium]
MNKNHVCFAELPAHSDIKERYTALKKILQYLKLGKIIKQKDKVAVKTHVGDVNNTTHISPELIKLVVSKIKEFKAHPFLIETSTLYSGPRSNAIGHINLAYEHGFTYEKVGAPFIMADGLLGNAEIEVKIPGILYKSVNIARDAVLTDVLVVLSHPTGHIVTGFGACIKNLGMGLCSKKGKLQQHSSIKPSIKKKTCTFCKQCIIWCPVQAIIEKDGKAFIIEEKCIGCGECLSICKFNAVKFNWGVQSEDLQKRMAEYALGAYQNKIGKSFFINVLTDMTKECDCMNITQKPIIPDIGILASFDPVAIDQATLDLTRERNGKDIGRISYEKLNPNIQLEHAEKIGLGSRKYKLIKI